MGQQLFGVMSSITGGGGAQPGAQFGAEQLNQPGGPVTGTNYIPPGSPMDTNRKPVTAPSQPIGPMPVASAPAAGGATMATTGAAGINPYQRGAQRSPQPQSLIGGLVG